MKKYDNYKDSGIEWIGEIPEHWISIPMRFLLRQKITDGPHETPQFLAEGIPFLSVDGIQNGELVFEGCRKISEEDHNRYKQKCIVEQHDILMGKAASVGKVAQVKVDFEFSIWSPLALLKPNHNKITSSYFEYFLKSTYAKDNANILSTFNTQQNISMTDIPRIYYVIPNSIEEQTAIANYLDRKTAEIDELIADKKRLLELYEEEKTAIINQAVTKGLNHDYEGLSDDPDFENQTEIKPSGKSKKSRFRPMKESGIEWLGEIPEHWEVKRLKYVVSLNDETLSEKTDEEMHIDYIEIGGLKNGNIGSTEYRFGNAPSRARRIVRNGDVIVSTVRTYLKAIAQISDDKDGYIASTGFAILRPKKIDSKFLGYYSYSPFFIDNTIANSVGVTYPAINASNILEFPIQIPPIEEQKAIVRHIETECALIDAKKAKTKKLIDLLTEYRTALISEVVTGKIKVTD